MPDADEAGRFGGHIGRRAGRRCRPATTVASAIGILAAALGALSGCAPSPTRPNIVLISLDTVRADHLPFHGYARDTMPALDAFAARGAVFDNAFAQAPSTVPTHASLFTGRYPFQHGTYGFPQALDAREFTLAEFFAERGYRTFGFASSIRFRETSGFAQGFASFESLHRYAKVARSPELTRLAIEQAAVDPDRPFFAFLHYFDAHAPYAPPAPYRTLWHPGLPDPTPEHTTTWLTEHRKPDARVEAETLDYVVALYDASLRYLDATLADLFRGFEKPANGRPTLWVITSDHGEEFKEHGGFLHSHSLFQELLHVPWVVVLDGAIAPGTRVAESAQSVDLFATLVELAGEVAPPGLAGRSFAARLRGGALPQPFGERLRDVVIVERTKTLGVIATLPWGRFKWFGEPGVLFRLDSDPQEQQNLAASRLRVARRLSGIPAQLGVPPVGVRLAAYDEARVRHTRPAAEDEGVAERLRALGYVDEVERASER